MNFNSFLYTFSCFSHTTNGDSMFYKYEIKNNGVEDILYLYLTMSYEFSRELSFESDKEITRRTKNFIKNNGIDYKGDKVYLVIDGVVVKSLDIKDTEENIEVLKENLYYSNEYYFVSVQLDDHSMIEISLKDYLMGVLATNMIPTLELETLKALCVLYRTYAYYSMSNYQYIQATNEFVLYKPISYYKLTWIDHYDEIVSRIIKAIDETDCLFMTYQHSYILPFIHFSNTGKTLSLQQYPYLTSVKSLWDLASPYYVETNEFTFSYMSKLLKNDISSNTEFKILEIDSNHFVKKIKIGNAIFTGEEFMRLFHLKSTNISIIINNDHVKIITKGWGNGLGLSIFGSNELAKNGCSFLNILKYYFPKTQINRYIKELSE